MISDPPRLSALSPAQAREPAGLQWEGDRVGWIGPLADDDEAPLVWWTAVAPGLRELIEGGDVAALDGWVRRLAMPRPLLDELASRCAAARPGEALGAARGQIFLDARWQDSLITACLDAGLAARDAPTPCDIDCVVRLEEGEILEEFMAIEGGVVALIRREGQPDEISLCWLLDGQEPRRLVFDGPGLYALPAPLQAPEGCFAVSGQLRGQVAVWLFDAAGELLAEARWEKPEGLDVYPPYRFSWHRGALWLHTERGHFRLALAPLAARSWSPAGPAVAALAQWRIYTSVYAPIAADGWLLLDRGQHPAWLDLATGEERALSTPEPTWAYQTPEGAILIVDHEGVKASWIAAPGGPARPLPAGHFWRALWSPSLLWLARHGDRSWLLLDRSSLAVVADLPPGSADEDGWLRDGVLALGGQLCGAIRADLDPLWRTPPLRDGAARWEAGGGQLLVFDGARLVRRTPFSGRLLAARAGLALALAGGPVAFDREGRVVSRSDDQLSLARDWSQRCVGGDGVWLQSEDRRSLWRWRARPAEPGPATLALPPRTLHRDAHLHGHELDNHEPSCPGYAAAREDLLGIRSRYEANNADGQDSSLRLLAAAQATLIGCQLQGPLSVAAGCTLILHGCTGGDPPEVAPGGLLLRVEP
jgi:hypothetical protein